MAIWNEIKKSINSNLSKPLNELIGESSDNTTIMDKLDTLLTNGGNSSGGRNVQCILTPPSTIYSVKCNDLPYVFHHYILQYHRHRSRTVNYYI